MKDSGVQNFRWTHPEQLLHCTHFTITKYGSSLMPSGELLLQTTHLSLSWSSDTNVTSLDSIDVFSFELFIPLVLGLGEGLICLHLLDCICWDIESCFFVNMHFDDDLLFSLSSSFSVKSFSVIAVPPGEGFLDLCDISILVCLSNETSSHFCIWSVFSLRNFSTSSFPFLRAFTFSIDFTSLNASAGYNLCASTTWALNGNIPVFLKAAWIFAGVIALVYALLPSSATLYLLIHDCRISLKGQRQQHLTAVKDGMCVEEEQIKLCYLT